MELVQLNLQFQACKTVLFRNVSSFCVRHLILLGWSSAEEQKQVGSQHHPSVRHTFVPGMLNILGSNQQLVHPRNIWSGEIFLKYCPRKVHQSYAGTITRPSCVDTSWALFTRVAWGVHHSQKKKKFINWQNETDLVGLFQDSQATIQTKFTMSSN